MDTKLENILNSKFVDLIEASYLLIDKYGVIKYSSSRIPEFSNIKAEDILNSLVLNYIHEDDRNIVRRSFFNTLREPNQKIKIICRIPIDLQMTSFQYVEAIGINYLDDPTIESILIAYWPVTEQIKGFKSFEDQYLFMQKLIEMLPIGIFYKDIHGRYIDSNPAFLKLMGLTKEEFIGKTVEETYRKEESDIFRSKDDSLFRSGGKQEYETYVIPKDKSIKRVLISKSTYSDSENEVAGIVGAITDISKLKNYEELLTEIRSKASVITENSKDMICELDPEGNYVYVNPAYTETLGYTSQELIGTNAFAKVHPDDLEALIRDYVNENGNGTFRYLSRLGKWIWLESKGRKYITQKGDINAIIISRDITNKRIFNNTYTSSSVYLTLGEITNSLKTQMEISINNFNASLKKLSPALTKKQSVEFEKIKQSMDFFSKYAHYVQHHTVSLHDYHCIITEIIEHCDHLADLYSFFFSIEIKKYIAPDLYQLNLKLHGFKEVITNLIINSIQEYKLSNNSDPLVINFVMKAIVTQKDILDRNCSEHGHKSEQIIIKKSTECLFIAIGDSGPGISNTILPKVFIPGFTWKDNGTGFGLPFVKDYVTSKEGIIWAESKTEKGTTFKIYIPIKNMIE